MAGAIDLGARRASTAIAAAPTHAARSPLSARESDILHWISIGKTNGEIGTILGISEFTVKNHVQNILAKLVVSNRAQAVGKALSLGLVGHAAAGNDVVPRLAVARPSAGVFVGTGTG
jgi:DNA-binding CsgD family transcriptional regulator